MTNFIPIFPLEMVVYPGEQVHLHIFEPRYKQLISECVQNGRLFGIPTVIQQKMKEIGTLIEVKEVVQTYENGELDIRTQGLRIFRILEVIKEVPEKMYSGAIVTYPENQDDEGNRELMQWVVKGVQELHRMLNISKDFRKPEALLRSYDVAHHAGLSLEEEYEVLELWQEIHRQEYLKRHLKKVLPMLKEMEQLKEKVKLNGHFRNLSSLDLNVEE
ncbi:MAG: LON peptidase substrate-binding domain-containing protein [Chitinophagaceae bacterium]